MTQKAPSDAVTTHRPGFQGELDSIRDGVMALSRDVVVQIERDGKLMFLTLSGD